MVEGASSPHLKSPTAPAAARAALRLRGDAAALAADSGLW
jgi:hypothetical protein